MVYKGKYKIIDNFITACDYEFVLSEIKEAIENKEKLLISPIASHTLVRAHYDKKLKKILDKFDYLVPDSQWIRWSILFLYGKDKNLKDRVYGPDLMLKTCKLAEKNGNSVFLYGNTEEVLTKLKEKLMSLFPNLNIAGVEASKFRELTGNEWEKLTNKINKSEGNIIFISLGSPKQEIFSYNLSKMIKKSSVIIPTGAAFDFISGSKPQAPKFVQDVGLEWFYRLLFEIDRLWKRYLVYGIIFILFILSKKAFFLLKIKK